ncbi:MAG TPA: secretin N-terminal domain-containing protein [Verrucomicrobiae bacterium]|jgi:general secretion pathway protein D|nr:secretin N-terminal domain-containing protein [Verrucomicrobiae bacterium]
MKTRNTGRPKLYAVAAMLGCCFALMWGHAARAQRISGPRFPGMPDMSMGGDNSSSKSDSKETGPWLPSEPMPVPTTITTNSDGTKTTNGPGEIQLSFQGANVDMIVQWLAQTTGKTVIKSPRVQCQVTITSSKKVSTREAIVLVYRALALEGFTAVESAQSILIVPEGQEPRIGPEVVSASTNGLPEGRVRVVKVFSLKHIQAAELRDRLRGALTDKGTIDLNERNNQIILTDYADNIRIADELISALDTDTPEDMSVRVITLKNVSAAALAKEIEPLYQKSSGKAVDVTADDRANALIVLSSAANYDAVFRLVSSLDTDDAQEKAMTTFLLKNADAGDVAKQLQDLSQSQSGGGSRFAYYFNQPSDSGQKKFNVVSDRRRNAVIVQAAPSQLPSIKKIIEELDAPVSDDSLAPKIYPLKYVSAVDLEDVLNELFLKKTQQRSYFDYFSDEPSAPVADRDVGRLYGKVRITSDPYSNTLIITSNSKENLGVVEEVINQLDRPSEAGESTMRITLKYAKASTVANSLNILFAKNGSPALRPVNPQNQNNQNQAQQQNQQQSTSSTAGFDLEQETKEEGYYPWIGGQPDSTRNSDGRAAAPPVSDLVGRVRAVSDQRGNAVMVSANVHFFPQVLKLIDELDAPSDQVSIEARILEVSSDYVDKLGVRWSPDGTQVFTADDLDNSFMGHVGGTYQKGFGGTTTVNQPPASGIVQEVAQLRSGVITGTAGMDLLIQFLKRNTDTTVLGEPQITINDNEMGKLFVGQQVPIPQNTQISSVGSQNTAITYKDVGVVLEVTPHINNSGDVQLKIHAESSTVVAGQTVLGGAVFDTRNFRTDLTAKDGQTLVLGGIIQRQISDIDRKTPFLGDIPGLKWMFKKKDKSTDKVELMVFLRTRVVRSPEMADKLLNDVNRRAPLIRQWEDEGKEPDKKLDKLPQVPRS